MKKIILISILFSFLISFGVTLAATDSTGNPPPTDSTGQETTPKTQILPKLQNPLKVSSVEGVIFLAVDIAIYIGVAFAILAIIWVGFKFVLAQGNSEKLKEAREYFLWIIIGLAVLISARVIVEIVQNTLIKSGVVNEKVFKP